MKEADYILVIIGAKSYTSKWMRWEINRAKQADTNLLFAAVKINSGNISPANLSTNMLSRMDSRWKGL
jgi:hypothetical protein